MKSTEAAMLCRYVAACCPQQKFDEYTPDAWFDLLGDLPFDLAKMAAAEVAKRQPFVSPSEIRTALRRMRLAVQAALRERVPLAIRLGDYDECAAENGAEYVAQRRRRLSDLAEEADRVLRAGGAVLSGVHIKDWGDGDDDAYTMPAQLITEIVDALPSIESAMHPTRELARP